MSAPQYQRFDFFPPVNPAQSTGQLTEFSPLPPSQRPLPHAAPDVSMSQSEQVPQASPASQIESLLQKGAGLLVGGDEGCELGESDTNDVGGALGTLLAFEDGELEVVAVGLELGETDAVTVGEVEGLSLVVTDGGAEAVTVGPALGDDEAVTDGLSVMTGGGSRTVCAVLITSNDIPLSNDSQPIAMLSPPPPSL